MEPQSTVAEADSTSIFPLLEAISNAVHSSQSLPDGILPSQSLPDGILPSQSLPDGILPSQSLPDGILPSQSLPDGILPSQSLPDGILPSQSIAASQAPLTVITSSGSLTVWSTSQSPPVADCPPSQSPTSEYLSSSSPPGGSSPSSVWTPPIVLPHSQSSTIDSLTQTLFAVEHVPSSQSPPTELQTSQNSQPTSVTLGSSFLGTPSNVLSQLSPSLVVPNPQSPPNAPLDLDSFYLPSTSSGSWRYDPLASPDWDRAGPPGNLCAGRVKKDLSSIFTEPLPGIFAAPEEDNLFKVHCLIIGPFDTPYEGGFFHFLVRFGPQYPLHPPRVRLLTTGGDSVRFNPNLYKNGKVCLSILGTWSGPAWSPASNLSSVLLSLQSLMNERPYHNEPGYEKEHNIGDSERYNSIIMHETIRVAVIHQLEGNTTAPPDLFKVMQSSFMEFYDHYVEICEKNMHRDGQPMDDPFGERRGNFQYSVLLKYLKRLKVMLKASGIPEIPETSLTAESDDVSSISGSEEGSPEIEGEECGEWP
ncbi:ubiquitin-conjugating enzyme E2 Z-like isoform X1 [Homarus americanus]|uniref:ubiquitin-conjugating enzyme E2 Z-like isoform X1 n=1 Tax=Homarus americanus TaxID=6706 RepID=UPI001C48AF5B|nr:ubiquitin-conjugating enzyme E2 Z-like isoform X1 [Homarus americanus]